VPQLVAGEDRAFDRRVPDSFFSEDVEDDGTAVRVIACPCGEEPRVPIARCLECSCGRFYLAVSTSVMVANGPLSRAPDSPDTEQPTGVVD